MWYMSVRKPMSTRPMVDVAFNKDTLRVAATEDRPIDVAKPGEGVSKSGSYVFTP